jgi:hypothetical protein
MQPDWGYSEQIISINPYKLIQTFFVMISSNISSDDGKSKIRRTSIEGHMCFYARKKIQHLNFDKPWQRGLING